MPRIRVSGIGPKDFYIDADGFATEDTLETLLAKISTLREFRKSADAEITRTAAAVRRLGNEATDAAKSSRIQTQQQKQFLANQEFVSKKLLNFANGLLNTLGDSQSLSNESTHLMERTLQTTVKGITDVGAKLGNMIPVIGPNIASLVETIGGGVSAVTGFYLGQVSGFKDVQRSFLDSGIQFTHGMDDIAAATQGTGLVYSDLTGAAADAASSIRLMSGGSGSSIFRLTKAFGSLSKEQLEGLRVLSYSNSEILAGMAMYTAEAERYGKELDTSEIATGAEAYLKNLRELSRLTGISAKEIQSKVEADRASLFVQNQLMNVDEKYRANVSQFLSTIPDQIKDFVLTGKSYTTESGIIVNQLPEFAKRARDILSKLATGEITNEESVALYKKLGQDPAILEEIRNAQVTFGQTVSSGYGPLSGMVDTLGIISGDLTQLVQQSKQAVVETVDLGPLSQTIVETQGAASKFNEAIQTASTNLTEFVSPVAIESMDSFSSTISYLVKMLTGTDAIAGLTSPTMLEKEEAAARQKLEVNAQSYASDTVLEITPEERNRKAFEFIYQQQLEGTASENSFNFGGLGTTLPKEGRALGGDVERGEKYLVGEKGPEVFEPSSNGTILPNDKPINVKMADMQIFKDMVDKLEILNKVNGQMLNAIERNNSLIKQQTHANA